MLSKAQNKYIRSLTQQKFRNEYNVFIAEGEKTAYEWLSGGSGIQMIIATEEWVAHNSKLLSIHPDTELHIVKEHELAALSGMQTPNKVLLVVSIPPLKNIPKINEWYIALDNIQDPGNMGTIIRIADWFGIHHIICSPECTDVYNPKVVQSAMGSHLRVDIYESELVPFLGEMSIPKIAATLDGENIYNMKRLAAGILIIGNESKGISDAVIAMATQKVTIPGKGGAESLNAGVSTGILCALLLPV